MSKSSHTGSHSRQTSGSGPPRLSLSATVCTKKGIAISIAISLVVYLVFIQWSTSKHQGGAVQPGQPSKFFVNDDPLAVKSTDPIGNEFGRRKKLYEEKCMGRKEGNVRELFHHRTSKLSVCHVPKAGCTFWKRVFRYLSSDHNRVNISSPFDIDRVQAHFGPSSNLPTYDYHTPEGRILVDASTKVMMVRSPYRRLWSAYVDKFVLPEWWLDHGKSIMFSRKEVQKNSCADDISFEEFLEYTLRNHERHWRPITETCDPCTYRPKFIGHVDTTFMRDVRYILTSQGLGSLLTDYNEDTRLTNDIENLIDYHYQLYEQRTPLHECLGRAALAGKLWRAMQLNGYYRMEHAFPQEQVEVALKDVTPRQARDSVVEIFLKEFRQNHVTEQIWISRRRPILVEAYRNVSDEVKKKVALRYHDDFDIFGFDTSFPGSSIY